MSDFGTELSEGYHTIVRFDFQFLFFRLLQPTSREDYLPIFLFHVGIGRTKQKIQWQNKQMIRWGGKKCSNLRSAQINSHRAQGIFWTNIYTAYILASMSSALRLHISRVKFKHKRNWSWRKISKNTYV